MNKLLILVLGLSLFSVWHFAKKESKNVTRSIMGGGKSQEKKDMKNLDSIIVGGGCFWGLEYWMKTIPGVVETEVGFAGGQTLNPTYTDVVSGETGHAEVVKIIFDKDVVSVDRILNVFMRAHIPTTLNAQKNDVGTQYRSVILVNSQEQIDAALKAIKEFDEKGGFDKPAVTELTKLKMFTKAEEYHQDYLKKNPNGYQCHVLRGEYK